MVGQGAALWALRNTSMGLLWCNKMTKDWVTLGDLGYYLRVRQWCFWQGNKCYLQDDDVKVE
jgi:hypothetical protein